MGLTNSLNIALSGLNFTQRNLDLVARNVANANTPGYTKKSILAVASSSGSQITGVSGGEVTRQVDAFLLQQLRTEYGAGQGITIKADFLSRLDQLYGQPGAANALDTVLNDFDQALQSLVTSPDQVGERQALVGQAQILANHLNRLSGDIQTMRQEAEANLSNTVQAGNTALKEIARLNREIQSAGSTGASVADLQDHRDRFVDELAGMMDIRTSSNPDGSVKVFTTGGDLLVDLQASQLSFDEHSSLGPTTVYDPDPTKRGVGTVSLVSLSGVEIDLFQFGNVRSGSIASLRELRDDILVGAQQQLDELAHGLALALSTTDVQGAPVTVGPNQGFDLDIAGLQAGNPISVSFTLTPPGTQQTVTFMRVDDPSVLPLSNDQTANPNDTVVGIDFSGGIGAAVAAMDAALGVSMTVSSPSANVIRILDDGGVNSSIDAVSAAVTAITTTDSGLALPLFVDLTSSFNPYTGSLDGNGQKTGFAGRIAINQDILADPSLLVRYSTSPPTDNGDAARPLELLARFSERAFTFLPVDGVGGVGEPFSGSIASFAQRIVNFQGQQAEASVRADEAQTIIVDALQSRLNGQVEVDVDKEMADLLKLQNAFAANARVMSVVQELIDILIRL